MGRRIVALLTVMSVLSGCTHIHRIDPVGSESDLQDLNRALQRRSVSVELPHRAPHGLPVTVRAERVHVDADSTSLTLLLDPGDMLALWGDPSYVTKRDTTLSTSAIIRMTTTNRFRGALDGTLKGLGIGVAFGALFGLVIGDPSLSTEETVAMGAIAFGAIGIGTGLAVGAMVGATHTFEFAHE